MDLHDEIRAAFAHFTRHGFPTMPDQAPPGATRGASWINALTMAEARAVDRACSEGARNGATPPGVARRSFGADMGAVMNRFPETEAQARDVRAMLDERASWAQLRDVNYTRQRVAMRDAVEQEAERRVVEADARDFENRVRIAADRRMHAMEKKDA